MTFRRARSEAQREQRRRAILETTAAMLAEMPVSEVSLNELSRRVGLAKSNVLRYVESREAALLELLHTQLEEWLTDVAAAPPPSGAIRRRTDVVAELLARSLAARPVLLDLLGAQFAVLDRNVSSDLAGHHKREYLAATSELARHLRAHVPPLAEGDAFKAAGATLLCAGTVWTAGRPTEAMLTAYTADPGLSALRIDVTETLTELIAVLIAGMLARA